MNRRSLLLSAAGAGLAVSGVAAPRGLAAVTATDDELAYASFGLAGRAPVADFYSQAAAAKIVAGAGRPRYRARRFQRQRARSRPRRSC